MKELRDLGDLNESQQKTLRVILSFRKPSFRTSEVVEKMDSEKLTGRSVGAVLGSLYRTGYLDKVQGGRDKMWKLSDEVDALKDRIQTQLNEVKKYWS